MPGLKVPPLEYEWARKLSGSVAPGAAVIAPNEVNTWIPTIHHHAAPVEVRKLYTKLFAGREGFSRDDAKHRGILAWAVTHPRWARIKLKTNRTELGFRRGLDKFDVQAVCLRRHIASDSLRRILRLEGFALKENDPRYEIWARNPEPGG